MQQQHRRSAAQISAGLVGLASVSAVIAVVVWTKSGIAQMAHSHGEAQCNVSDISCGSTVTPAFAPDGTLWIAFAAGGRVSVTRSPDLGRAAASAAGGAGVCGQGPSRPLGAEPDLLHRANHSACTDANQDGSFPRGKAAAKAGIL